MLVFQQATWLENKLLSTYKYIRFNGHLECERHASRTAKRHVSPEVTATKRTKLKPWQLFNIETTVDWRYSEISFHRCLSRKTEFLNRWRRDQNDWTNFLYGFSFSWLVTQSIPTLDRLSLRQNEFSWSNHHFGRCTYESHDYLSLVFAGWRQIMMIKFVAHASHISQPWDCCVFAWFNMACRAEQKAKRTKSEMLRIYRAIFVFHPATRIPLGR
jgi:hypothetical protein